MVSTFKEMRKNVFFSEKKNPLISVKHSSLECNNFVNLNHGPHHKLKKDKKKTQQKQTESTTFTTFQF